MSDPCADVITLKIVQLLLVEVELLVPVSVVLDDVVEVVVPELPPPPEPVEDVVPVFVVVPVLITDMVPFTTFDTVADTKGAELVCSK